MKIIKSALVASVVLLLVGFAASFSPSKPLSMIEDINIYDVNSRLSNNEKVWLFKDHLYYTSYTPETGTELWITDGDQAELLRDLTPGANGTTFYAAKLTSEYFLIAADVEGETKLYQVGNGADPKGLQEVVVNGRVSVHNELLKVANDTIYFLVNFDGFSNIYSFENGALVAKTDFNDSDNVDINDYSVFGGEVFLSARINYQSQIVKVNSDYTLEHLHNNDNWDAQLRTNDYGVFYRVFDVGTGLYSFYRYSDGSSTLLGSLEEHYNRMYAYADYLAVVGSDISGNVPQLWASNGGAFTQLSSFADNSEVQLRQVTSVNEQLYYYSYDDNYHYNFYNLNGVTLTKTSLVLEDYLNENYEGKLTAFGDSIYVWGVEPGSGNTVKLYTLNDSTVDVMALEEPTERYHDGIFSFIFNGEPSFLINNGPSAKIYTVEVASSTATVTSRFSEGYMQYIENDGSQLYLLAGDYSSGRALHVFSGDILKEVTNAGVTGSSNPENFTVSGNSTYFVATEDSDKDALWVTDGRSLTKVSAAFNQTDNVHIQEIVAIDSGALIVVENNISTSIWKVTGDEAERFEPSFDYISEYETAVSGDFLYFNAYEFNTSNRKFWMASSEGMAEVSSNANSIIQVDERFIYQTSEGGDTKYWIVDGQQRKEINVAPFADDFWFQGAVAGGGHLYLLAAERDSFKPLIYLVLDSGDLKEITGIPTDRGHQYLSMKEGVLVRYDNPSTNDVAFSVLEGEQVTHLNQEYRSFSSSDYKSTMHRDYFLLIPSGSRTQTIHYYNNGEMIDTGWGSSGYEVIEKDDISDWVIIKSYSENKYLIFENDGEEMKLINSIPFEGELRDLVSTGNMVTFLLTGSVETDSLYVLSPEGEINKIKPAPDFHFSYEREFAKGHGKWLFIRACTLAHGCEPYSLNLNQLPTAEFDSETSYFSRQQVILDASTTTDSDGNILEYHWTQLAGPEIDFEGIEGETISFKAPEVDSVQDVVIELTVVDDGYDKDTTSKSFKVKPNSAPTISIDAPESAEEGVTVTLDASGTVDNEGEELSFNWSVEAGGVTLSKQAEAVTSFEVPSISSDTTATLTLTVTDASGYQSVESIDIQLLNKSSGGNNDDNNSDGGSGGGSTSMFLLLLLSLVYLRRVVIK